MSLGNFPNCDSPLFRLSIERLDSMQKVEIVVVDDAKSDLILAEREIRRCGILNPISAFSFGGQALSYFSEGGPGSRPVRPLLLIVDVVMSPMSGLEFLRQWKKLPAAAKCFPMLLSGHNHLRAISEGYQLGARTFLFKPLKGEELIRALGSFPNDLRLVRNGAGLTIQWAGFSTAFRSARPEAIA